MHEPQSLANLLVQCSTLSPCPLSWFLYFIFVTIPLNVAQQHPHESTLATTAAGNLTGTLALTYHVTGREWIPAITCAILSSKRWSIDVCQPCNEKSLVLSARQNSRHQMLLIAVIRHAEI
jgi:hypothetical protein